jgi:very-short-patch-repair endonuclease
MRKLKLNPKREALLVERAHAMRQAPTPSEAALWRLLSGGKLGVGFRRQVPLGGRYVADFLAPWARLVVEVDGAWHRGRTEADARRDRVLQRLGYRVLHLPAKLVLEQPLEAVARVRAALTVSSY